MRTGVFLWMLLCLAAQAAAAQGEEPVTPYAAVGAPEPEAGEVIVLNQAEAAAEAAGLSGFHRNLRERAAHGPSVRSEVVERLPDRHYALEIQNGWAVEHFKVPPEDIDRRQWREIPEPARWMARARFAPVQQMEALVRTRYGKSLSEVYQPASGPFYSDAKGLHWDKKGGRYVLVVKGEIDRSANRCFKAAIDVEAGELISETETQCQVR